MEPLRIPCLVVPALLIIHVSLEFKRPLPLKHVSVARVWIVIFLVHLSHFICHELLLGTLAVKLLVAWTRAHQLLFLLGLLRLELLLRNHLRHVMMHWRLLRGEVVPWRARTNQRRLLRLRVLKMALVILNGTTLLILGLGLIILIIIVLLILRCRRSRISGRFHPLANILIGLINGSLPRLGKLYSPHLADWNSALTIDPFTLNNMFFFELHDSLNTTNVRVCNEAEAPGLLRPFVL
jgi:hypothetical protein